MLTDCPTVGRSVGQAHLAFVPIHVSELTQFWGELLLASPMHPGSDLIPPCRLIWRIHRILHHHPRCVAEVPPISLTSCSPSSMP